MEERKDRQSQISSEDSAVGKIGVVTVTYNSGAVLTDFFSSVDGQDYDNFIVIAVDNASTDDTLHQLRAWNFPRLVLIANAENAGVAAGNNQGIRAALAAGCHQILLVNNDVVFEKDLFRRLLNGLQEFSCLMTTPVIYYGDQPDVVWAAGGTFEPQYGYRPRHLGEGKKDVGQFIQPKRISYAPTCCVMIHCTVFDRIGLMDERYFVYSDDVDFMYRALRADIPMFLLPVARLWHKVNSLTGGGQSDFAIYYGTRGRTLFLCKHLGNIRGTFWTWIYLLFYWAKLLLGKDTRHRYSIRRDGTLAGRKIGLEQLVDSSQ